jgi:hypothetical protein
MAIAHSGGKIMKIILHKDLYDANSASHTECAGMSIAHSGGKIMKIILHKDLYDANSTFTFQYLTIHEFIFLNYIKHFNKKCTAEPYIHFDNISHRFYKLYFNKNFSMNTKHNTFWKPPVSIIRRIKTSIHMTIETGSF